MSSIQHMPGESAQILTESIILRLAGPETYQQGLEDFSI
jgi:hypothetical protein